jgi:hypothetical protein
MLSRVGVCMTYKTGFGLDLYATCYNISQITIFDWTHSTSDHSTLIHYALSSELAGLGFWLYSLRSDLTENMSIA